MCREFANQYMMSIPIVNRPGLASKLALICIRNNNIFSLVEAALVYIDLPCWVLTLFSLGLNVKQGPGKLF